MSIITNNTHNAALLNRAHLINFFLLLLDVRILRPKDHLFLTNLINLGLVSPTHNNRRKKKEKEGIGLHFTGFGSIATRNHYQRARGERPAWAKIFSISKSHRYTFLFIRKFSNSHFIFKHIIRTINLKF